MRRRSAEICVYVPTTVALYILNQKRDSLTQIEARYGIRVMVAQRRLADPAGFPARTAARLRRRAKRRRCRARSRRRRSPRTTTTAWTRTRPSRRRPRPRPRRTAKPVARATRIAAAGGRAPAAAAAIRRGRGRAPRAGRRGAERTATSRAAAEADREGPEADGHDRDADERRRRRRGRRGGRWRERREAGEPAAAMHGNGDMPVAETIEIVAVAENEQIAAEAAVGRANRALVGRDRHGGGEPGGARRRQRRAAARPGRGRASAEMGPRSRPRPSSPSRAFRSSANANACSKRSRRPPPKRTAEEPAPPRRTNPPRTNPLRTNPPRTNTRRANPSARTHPARTRPARTRPARTRGGAAPQRARTQPGRGVRPDRDGEAGDPAPGLVAAVDAGMSDGRRVPRLAVCLLVLALAVRPARAESGPPSCATPRSRTDIRTMAAPIWRAAGLEPADVDIYLVQDNQLNSFVAGGQAIFINTGLILRAENAEPADRRARARDRPHRRRASDPRAARRCSNASIETIIAMVVGAAAVGGRAAAARRCSAPPGSASARSCNSRWRRRRPPTTPALNFLDRDLPVGARAAASFSRFCKARRCWPATARTPVGRTHPLTAERIEYLRDHVAARAAARTRRTRPARRDCCSASRSSCAPFSIRRRTTLAAYPGERQLGAGALCAGDRLLPHPRSRRGAADDRRADPRLSRTTPISAS